MTKCLQVRRGCFFAAKANIFCENAARSIDSPDDQLEPILHFHPDLLTSPKVTFYSYIRLRIGLNKARALSASLF